MSTELTVERHNPATARVYVVLREKILRDDPAHSCLSIAHAAMAAVREWGEDDYFQWWMQFSFRKFLGVANEKEWAKLKASPLKHLVMNESGIEGNPEVSMIFEPMGGDEVPNVLKFLRAFSPKTAGAA